VYKQLKEDEYNKFPFIRIPEEGEKLTAFDGFQKLIMLDRYSLKDTTLKTLKIGDLVLTIVKDDSKFPLMGYGEVINMDKEFVSIKIDYPDNFKGKKISKTKTEISKPLELYWEQIAYRVSKAVADAEITKEKKDKYFKEFYWLLSNMYYIPGGRILYGAGNPANVTLFNCFSLGNIPDSRSGIIDHIKTATEIMSRGGGVGSCISTLRPRNAIVRGVNGFSSGSVSWANYLSGLTHLISQAGSRRGAQMIGMHIWHPDVLEFIMCKIQNPYLLDLLSHHSNSHIAKIAEKNLIRNDKGEPIDVVDKQFMSGANISVLITDDFMERVKAGKQWELKYPDLENLTKKQKEIYDTEWESMNGIEEWEEKGLPIKIYETIPAQELWDLINTCARYSAEPGIIFIDRYNKEANSYYYENITITNPCGEQGLPKYSVCNLGAINLAKIGIDGGIYFGLLEKVARVSQRFSDNVIDISYYFLDKNEKMAKKERRVGKGIMGLADLMINLKLKYGSPKMVQLTEQLFNFIAIVSYDESINLAIEKGSFDYLDKDRFLESGYMKQMPENIRERVKQHGIRNVTSLTVAPTGSTASMIGVSNGIEPYFAYQYYRSGRMGEFIKINTPIAQKYFNENPNATKLPDYYISAMELSPEKHIKVQAAVQKWVDSSISKTVNAPSTFTVEDNKKLYELAYEKGLKGITVYVDKSRDTQVLNIDKDKLTKSTKLCKIQIDKTTGNLITEC